MSLKQYEAFVKTAELGSLTKAAQELGSTQSRISHILGDMEEKYGFRLLERSRGGVKLTPQGEVLYEKMREILSLDGALQSIIEDMSGANGGIIRLGAFTSVAVHWLPSIINAFTADRPNAEFKMYSGDYHDMEQWLRDGTIDLGFIALPAPDGVLCAPLFEDELVAILPKGHRLAEYDAVPVSEMAREPFITILESSGHDIRRALGDITPDVKFTTKDDYAVIAMVEQNMGVSIVPRLLIKGRENNLEVRSLSPRASRTIALASKARGESSPVIDAFIKVAVKWCKENA